MRLMDSLLNILLLNVIHLNGKYLEIILIFVFIGWKDSSVFS